MRYAQILRIEAGVSEYDWLVQDYRERQVKNNESGNTSGGTTTTHTGTISDTNEHGHTIARTGTVGNKEEFTPGVTKTETDTRAKTTSGGYTDTKDDRGYSYSDTREIQTLNNDDSTTKTVGWDTLNRKRLEKQNPMSISYQNGVAEPVTSNTSDGTGTTSGGGLDWTNPSAQAADMGRDGHGEEVTSHQGHIRETNKHTVDPNGVAVTNSRVYNSLANTNSGALTTTHTGKDTTEKTRTDNTLETHGGIDTLRKTLNNTDAVTVLTNSLNESTLREIYTGRSEDPAAILKRAVQYIIQTDAFEWLCRQLDVCFLAVYDI